MAQPTDPGDVCTPSPAERTAFLLVAAIAVALAAGCGPNAGASAEKFMVFDRNSKTGEYVLEERQIQSLENISTVEGQYANLRAGGTIKVATGEPTTAKELRNSIQIEGDQPPTVDYDIRSDGVAVPWDFHSAMMFTLYHHLEVARNAFVSWGVDESKLGRIPVFYYARLQTIVPVDLLTDNAAYAFTLDAFLIPPTLVIQQVPLAANRGVIIHEYSHRIFNRLVHNGTRAPEYLLEPWPDPAANRLSSINEGIADIFAALQTDDPNFIGASISKERFDIDRNLAKDRSYTEEIQDHVRNQSTNAYNPYELGSVIASTVWTLKEPVGNDRLATAVLETLRSLSGVGASNFTTARFFNELHGNLPEGARTDACATFKSRLDAIREDLTCDE